MSIHSAATSGDRRRTLEEIRDRLALAMDLAEPNMLPQLSGQLRTTLAELADMGGEGSAVKRNELGERREARIAAAATVAPAVKKGRKRGA